ncbi:MAG: sulfite exporter TauE/SafE family protein [Salinivirgaceae bacterium]|nr:sulfite exporter TauE/SafE family protein [Salinivirgaceae bacterium]
MIEFTWLNISLIIGAGFLAGFINTLAGSGSLITVPLLIFMGLPANIANATNRVMILLTNIVGVSSFRQQKVFKLKDSIWLSLPAIVGAIIGALIAVDINEEIMTKIIGGLMVFLLITIIYKPQKWLKDIEAKTEKKFKFWQYILMFFVGLYGGFIQIGVGVFILSGLVLSCGFDLVKANAVKLFIILMYTIFALGIFIYNGQVNFIAGFLLAAGSMIGSFIATRVAVEWGPKFVRIILLTVVIVAIVKLLGIYEFITNLF